MEHIIRGVRDAVAHESWYSALALALMLPDACGRIELPGHGVGARYRAWTNTYFGPYVTPDGQPYLTGGELYDLRNRFLHQGAFTLTAQAPADPDDAQAMFEVLNRVVPVVAVGDFDIVPARRMTSTTGTVPERRTDYFVAVRDLCEWICRAVEDWLVHARADARMAPLIDGMDRIMWMEMNGVLTPL
jgi:hypothetical protein